MSRGRHRDNAQAIAEILRYVRLNRTPLAALPPLRDLIRDAGLRADKKFGQNFLLDLNLAARIARAAEQRHTK